MKTNRFDNLKVNVLGRRLYSPVNAYFGGNKKTNWLKRFIIEKQNYLESRCVSIWHYKNHLSNNDERGFIFGKFKDEETKETTIVTLGCYHEGIGWLPAR